MKARQGKILSLVAIGVLAAAIAVNVAVTLVTHQPLSQLASMAPGLLLLAVFATFWNRYAKLEAEHGPDYAASQSGGRAIILALGIVVAISAGLVAYLLVRRG